MQECVQVVIMRSICTYDLTFKNACCLISVCTCTSEMAQCYLHISFCVIMSSPPIDLLTPPHNDTGVIAPTQMESDYEDDVDGQSIDSPAIPQSSHLINVRERCDAIIASRPRTYDAAPPRTHDDDDPIIESIASSNDDRHGNDSADIDDIETNEERSASSNDISHTGPVLDNEDSGMRWDLLPRREVCDTMGQPLDHSWPHICNDCGRRYNNYHFGPDNGFCPDCTDARGLRYIDERANCWVLQVGEPPPMNCYHNGRSYVHVAHLNAAARTGSTHSSDALVADTVKTRAAFRDSWSMRRPSTCLSSAQSSNIIAMPVERSDSDSENVCEANGRDIAVRIQSGETLAAFPSDGRPSRLHATSDHDESLRGDHVVEALHSASGTDQHVILLTPSGDVASSYHAQQDESSTFTEVDLRDDIDRENVLVDGELYMAGDIKCGDMANAVSNDGLPLLMHHASCELDDSSHDDQATNALHNVSDSNHQAVISSPIEHNASVDPSQYTESSASASCDVEHEPRPAWFCGNPREY